MSSWLSPHPHAPRPVQTEVEVFWYLNLSAEQQAAYDQLSKHLKETGQLLPGLDDQFTLLRFLKARQWDVHRATAMYQNMVKWRHEYQTDTVYETFAFPEKDAVLKHYPHFYHNTDKYGRPLYIELLGATDASKILEATTLDRLVTYHVCEWETLRRRILPACSVLAGRPIITKAVILDLRGMSMKNFGSAAQKILKTVVHIDQDYYCESLGQMFIVNTPTVFRMIWAVVNPLLEERTRRKIVILGSDYLPTITQLVPLENLPTCLGGTSPVQHDMKSPVGAWTTVELPEQPATAAAPAKSSRISNPDTAANGAGANGLADHANGVALKADASAADAAAVLGTLHHAATAPARIAPQDSESISPMPSN